MKVGPKSSLRLFLHRALHLMSVSHFVLLIVNEGYSVKQNEPECVVILENIFFTEVVFSNEWLLLNAIICNKSSSNIKQYSLSLLKLAPHPSPPPSPSML